MGGIARQSDIFGYQADSGKLGLGKAILLAYLNTARFLRTCRCPVIGEKQEDIEAPRDFAW